MGQRCALLLAQLTIAEVQGRSSAGAALGGGWAERPLAQSLSEQRSAAQRAVRCGAERGVAERIAAHGAGSTAGRGLHGACKQQHITRPHAHCEAETGSQAGGSLATALVAMPASQPASFAPLLPPARTRTHSRLPPTSQQLPSSGQ